MKQLSKRRVARHVDLSRACVIREGAEEYCIYPMDDVMEILGKKWTMFVISVLGNNERTRFSDLYRQLKSISPRTLTDRLKELETLGLIRRTSFPEIPPRVEYALTEDGRRMRKALIPFLKWSIDYELRKGATPQ